MSTGDLAGVVDALRSTELRLELASVFSVSEGQLPMGRLSVRHGVNGRWRVVVPMLVAPKDEPTRAGLLRMIAGILELEVDG